MENVQEIVSQIINSPELRENLEHTVRRTICERSTPVSVTPTRGTATALNVREELNRLFPSISSRSRRRNSNRPGTSRQTEVSNNATAITFYKDVFLTQSKDSNTTYKHASKSLAYETGYAVSDVAFHTNWMYEDVKLHLKSVFTKLNEMDFEILLPVGGRLVKVQREVTLNGATLKRLFHQKAIYLRPIENFCHDERGESEDDFESLPPSLSLSTNNHSPISVKEQSNEVLSVEDVLRNLRLNIDEQSTSHFNIFRSDIFQCCIRAMKRKSYNPLSRIDVKFTDIEGTSEGAVDAGGPLREMFRLVLDYIKDSHLFIGKNKKFLTLNSMALEQNEYFYAGALIALSLVHGGPGPHFFSENLYEALLNGIDKCTASLSFVDRDIAEKIEKILKIEDISELKNYVMDESIFSIAGIYLINSIEERENVYQEVVKFYNCHRVRPAFDQFLQGLKTCYVYDAIVSNPELFRQIMCNDKQTITSTLIQNIFEITYSEIGSSKRQMENRTVAFFRDVLQDIEDGDDEVSLTDLLIFATSCDNIPPLGFPWKPKIVFLHDSNSLYPTANTCGLELRLPCHHENYEKFKKHMVFAIGNCNDFAFA